MADDIDRLGLQELYELRRFAHRFMSEHAATWWQAFGDGGVDVLGQPESAELPPERRFKAMAASK